MVDDDDFESDKTMVMKPTAKGKRQPPPAATLTCVDTSILKGGPGSEIRLEAKEVTVGRGNTNTVALKAEGISRDHARFIAGDGVWGVEDRQSTNGVRVNNSRVEHAWLNPGDTVAIGRVCYKYTLATTKPAAAPAQLDLGDYEKTVIMRPGAGPAKPAAAPAAKPSPAPVAKPAVAVKPASAAKPAVAAKSATAKPARSEPAAQKSGAMLWIVIGVVVVVAAVAAFALM